MHYKSQGEQDPAEQIEIQEQIDILRSVPELQEMMRLLEDVHSGAYTLQGRLNVTGLGRAMGMHARFVTPLLARAREILASANWLPGEK